MENKELDTKQNTSDDKKESKVTKEDLNNVDSNKESKNLDEKSVEVKKVEKPEKPKASASKFIVSKSQLPGSFNPFERATRFSNKPQREVEFEERVLEIKRVIKVTKGGRRFKFSALVVIGDRKGKVGYAIGKHIEVPEAIKKAIRQARKNIFEVKIVTEHKTIPHSVIGKHGASEVMLKPAPDGKGIISSDKIRAVVELAGYENIYSKSLGSNTSMNVVLATIDGLMQMKTKPEIESLREKELKEIK